MSSPSASRGPAPTSRVLFISGYPADTVFRNESPKQERRFIEKPYLVADLARKVREILDQGHILDGPR